MRCPGQFSPVAQSCLFVTPWTAARQAFLSFTNSQSLLKLMSIKSVMLSNHLILCRPLLLPPSIFPSIRVFSNESVLCIRWPKSWSFSFSISPSSENSGLISFRYPPRSSTKREAASYLNQEDREDLRSAVLAFARGFPRALSRHPGPLMAPGLGLTLLLCVQPL